MPIARPLSLTLAVLLLAVQPASAQDWPFGLGKPSAGAWDVSVSTGSQVADPAWTTVVYARRAPAVETASLGEANGQARPSGRSHPVHSLNGLASYYGAGVGALTASGEAFDKTAMTAAHRTLPMGSKVKVTNLDNGRSVVLRVNDRGPFVAGRVIDVSEGAADILGMRHAGVAKVQVEPISN